jgi:hypothetical protein
MKNTRMVPVSHLHGPLRSEAEGGYCLRRRRCRGRSLRATPAVPLARAIHPRQRVLLLRRCALLLLLPRRLWLCCRTPLLLLLLLRLQALPWRTQELQRLGILACKPNYISASHHRLVMLHCCRLLLSKAPFSAERCSTGKCKELSI